MSNFLAIKAIAGLRDSGLAGQVRAVAVAYAMRASSEGEVWAGPDRLARDSGFSVATVKRARATLRALGWLVRVRRGGDDRVTDTYRVVPTADISQSRVTQLLGSHSTHPRVRVTPDPSTIPPFTPPCSPPPLGGLIHRDRLVDLVEAMLHAAVKDSGGDQSWWDRAASPDMELLNTTCQILRRHHPAKIPATLRRRDVELALVAAARRHAEAPEQGARAQEGEGGGQVISFPTPRARR